MIPGRQGRTAGRQKGRPGDTACRRNNALLRSAAASDSFGATTAPHGTAMPALDAMQKAKALRDDTSFLLCAMSRPDNGKCYQPSVTSILQQ